MCFIIISVVLHSPFAPQLWQVTCQDGSQSQGSFCVHGGALKLLKPQHRHQSVLLTAGRHEEQRGLHSPTATSQQHMSRKYGLNFNNNSVKRRKQATRSRNGSTVNQNQSIFIMIIIMSFLSDFHFNIEKPLIGWVNEKSL